MDLRNKKDMPRSVTSIVDEGFFYIREYVDRKLLVLLLDGRSIFGILRSFDHFGNLVLETVFERIVVGNHYCDNPMGGLLVLRAENIILIGELVISFPSHLNFITTFFFFFFVCLQSQFNS
ncbi:hypothetical protein IC582_008302 [Cucumis melo]